MKKINVLLKNENVMMAVIIGGVFLVTGIITLYAIYTNQ